MATERTVENQLRKDINDQRRRAVLLACWLGIPAVIAASFLLPMGIPFWALLLYAAFRAANNAGSPERLRGAIGEERALEVLAKLPQEYVIYNQVKLPDSRSRTGYREADFIVIGPNGLFVVENKDFRGTIVGTGEDAKWEQHKVGRGGTPYVTYARNPVRQVQVYVSLLAKLFSSKGIKAWIMTPIVSLSRDNCIDQIRSDRVRVIQGTDLCEVILGYKQKLAPKVKEEIITIMEELRQNDEIQGTPA